MWNAEGTLRTAFALRVHSVVFRLSLASLAKMQSTHITHVSYFRTAVHALPDNCLLFIVDATCFLTKANLL